MSNLTFEESPAASSHTKLQAKSRSFSSFEGLRMGGRRGSAHYELMFTQLALLGARPVGRE